MAKRPVAMKSSDAEVEALDFSSPNHPPLCNLVMTAGLEPCDCGLAETIQTDTPPQSKPAAAESPAQEIHLRINGQDTCGVASAWQVNCTKDAFHNGSHSWQDQDRFPAVTATYTPEPEPVDTPTLTVSGFVSALPDASEVWAEKPAIRQDENGKWTATALALPGLQDVKPKGTARMNVPTEPITMTATLKRAGSKSGTQADPDSYLEMVLRSNDMDSFGVLGWLTGKLVTLTIQPLQPVLTGMYDGENDSTEHDPGPPFEGDDDRVALMQAELDEADS